MNETDQESADQEVWPITVVTLHDEPKYKRSGIAYWAEIHAHDCKELKKTDGGVDPGWASIGVALSELQKRSYRFLLRVLSWWVACSYRAGFLGAWHNSDFVDDRKMAMDHYKGLCEDLELGVYER